MSLKECLDKARKAKLVPEDDIRDVYRHFQQLQNQLEIRQTGPGGDLFRAELKAVQTKLDQLHRKKYRRALQITRTRINVSDVRSHPEGIRRGVMSKQAKDVEAHLEVSPWSNVDNRSQAILGWLHSLMERSSFRASHKESWFYAEPRTVIECRKGAVRQTDRRRIGG